MGLRLLSLIIVVALLVWLARRLLTTPAGPAAKPPRSHTMVRCDHCGLHVPMGEALSGPDGNYCCEAHRRAGRSG